MLRVDLLFKNISLSKYMLYANKEKETKKSSHPTNRNVKCRCKNVQMRETILFYLFTHRSSVFSLYKSEMSKVTMQTQQLGTNHSKYSMFKNIESLDKGQSWDIYFLFLHIKLSFYLKLCLSLGSRSEKSLL